MRESLVESFREHGRKLKHDFARRWVRGTNGWYHQAGPELAPDSDLASGYEQFRAKADLLAEYDPDWERVL